MKLSEVSKQPVLYMPIGPSGSGKSTKFNWLKQDHPTLQQYSYDQLRLNWYGGENQDYEAAWKAASADSNFNKKAKDVFVSMVLNGDDIYVDNTNLTPKARRFFLTTAKQHGYKTIALVFNVPTTELLARQRTRTDKTVPDAAVQQQASVLKGPADGEFDAIEYV